MSAVIDVNANESFDQFVDFVRHTPGELRPGVSFLAFASYLVRNRRTMEPLITALESEADAAARPMVEGPLGDAPTRNDYDSWSEKKRINANLDALRVLRVMQREGRTVPLPEDRAFLWAYTGWGGIDPAKLPEDSGLFPSEYVDGIRQWRDAVRLGQVPTSNVFAGLRHQFFTPLDVCVAMWGLAQRLVVGSIQHALEPSVGVGRMLQTTPPDLDVAWDVVEYDPLLAEIVTASHPNARVYVGTFESFYAEHADRFETSEAGYDAILMNPPYPDRPERDRKADPAGAKWKKAHTYFVERASRMLRPGGVLVAITPAGEIIGADAENVRLRKWLASTCHFAGAVFPPSDVFPSVNPMFNTFAIHAWIRRAPNAVAPLDVEMDEIIAGNYLELDYAQTNTIGEWRDFNGKLTVHGTFDPALVVNAVMRPLSATEVAEINDWLANPTPIETPDPISPPGAPANPSPTMLPGAKPPPVHARQVDIAAMTRADADALDAGLAIAFRLQRFQILATRGGRDAAKAEAGRAEVLRDLQQYVARYGNPHRVAEILARGADTAPLLAAITPSGEPARFLQNPITDRPVDAPQAGASVRDIVFWYSKRYGVCTETDLARHGFVDALEPMIADPDIAIEFRGDGDVWFYWFTPEIHMAPARDGSSGQVLVDPQGRPIMVEQVVAPAYLGGDLYDKMARVDAALGTDPRMDVRAKLDAQRAALTAGLSERSLSDIQPTPRSGFVPVECLQAFVNARLVEIMVTRNVPNVTLTIESGRLHANTNGSLKDAQGAASEAQLSWLTFFLGYWNRDTQSVDPDQIEAKRKNVYQSTDLEGRIAAEHDLETQFATWLAVNEEWRIAVELAYNQAYAGFKHRAYDQGDLGVTRMAPTFVPGGHQNSAVRQLTERHGGMCCFGVGGGKCRRFDDPMLTNRGLVTIGSLFGTQAEGPEIELTLRAPAGLEVLGHRDGQPVWRAVRALYRQRISDSEATIIVETARGARTEITAAHQLLVARDGRFAWIRAESLIEGDVVSMAGSIPEIAPPEGVLPFAPDDPRLVDLCVLLAWQIAEGNESEGTTRITQEDASVLEGLAVRAKRLLTDSPDKTRYGLDTIRIEHPADRASYLSICSPDYQYMLAKAGWNGWGTLSAARKFPEWFVLLPASVLRQVISAYFDGDGGMEAGDVSATSASELLVDQMQYMLLRFGIHSSVHPRQARATNGRMSKSETYYRLTIRGEDVDRFRESIGFGAAEKQALLAATEGNTRNPNMGIPIRDVLDMLGEFGVTWRMLGISRKGGLLSVSAPVLAQMAERAEYLVSLEARAEFSRYRGGHPAARTTEIINAPEACDALIAAARTMRERLAASYHYDVIAKLTPGERGGFVYDAEVDADVFDEKNYVSGIGGFIAHNTATGLLTAAYWRQIGLATRPLVTMPNNVLFNWYSECRNNVLPDYRIGIIGFTIDTETGVKLVDTSEQRRIKWQRYAQGDYDLLLVPYSTFLDDVEMRNDSILDILKEVWWLQRQLGVDAEERALLTRRIAAAEEDVDHLVHDVLPSLIESAEYAKNQSDAESDSAQIALGKQQNKVARIKSDIERWKAALVAPPKGAIAQVQQDLDNIAENRPFRPRMKQSAEWKASWKREQMVAFLRARGIHVEPDGATYLLAAYEPDEWTGDMVRDLVEKVAKSGGKPLRVREAATGKRGLTKAQVVEILDLFFPRPTQGGSVPKPALAFWEDLGCDCLIIDEAHNFKNIYYAQPRLGEGKIEYMGAASQEMAPRAWDMYLKCQYLLRTHDDGGVIPLTATPLKNSPLEVYNLLSLVSARVWKNRKVRSSEEFIDRYCTLETQFVPKPDLSGALSLSMVSFNEQHMPELEAMMAEYMDRKTIRDLLRLGVIKSVPLPKITRREVPLDPIADKLYDVCADVVADAEIKAKEEENPQLLGALRLLTLDLFSKIALDPRLLADDVGKVEKLLGEDLAKQTKYDAWKKKSDAWQRSAPGATAPGNEPPRPLLDSYREFLEQRLDLLQKLNVEKLRERYGDLILPKYQALAEHVLANRSCGHVVFADYNDVHEYIKDAIHRLAGVPLERIAVMTGDLDPGERDLMARMFNGQDRKMDALTGETEVSPEVQPEYDIIIGNSAVMAEGVNLQRRTCAIHHLTFPWEPATITQRNGRGVRQGNRYQSVDVIYYLAMMSFDGFKLDKVLGKSAWQTTLFAADERSTDNPLAGTSISRVEMMLQSTMRKDPEGAKKLAGEIEAAEREKMLAKQQDMAQRKFFELVAQYARARNQKTVGARDALLAQGDVQAASLRTTSSDVFPNKDLIDLARETVVYLNSKTGLWLAKGEHACLRAVGTNIERRVEVIDVEERGMHFTARTFGSPFARMATTPAGILGTSVDRGTPIERIDCPSWDRNADDAAILASSDLLASRLFEVAPSVMDRIGVDKLWDAIVTRAERTRNGSALWGSSIGYLPLKLRVDDPEDPGAVYLLAHAARDIGDWRAAQVAAELRRFVPIVPQLPKAWATFVHAVTQDRVHVITRLSPFTLAPLDMSFAANGQPISVMANTWFRHFAGVSPAAVKEMNARRERKLRGAPRSNDSRSRSRPEPE